MRFRPRFFRARHGVGMPATHFAHIARSISRRHRVSAAGRYFAGVFYIGFIFSFRAGRYFIHSPLTRFQYGRDYFALTPALGASTFAYTACHRSPGITAELHTPPGHFAAALMPSARPVASRRTTPTQSEGRVATLFHFISAKRVLASPVRHQLATEEFRRFTPLMRVPTSRV